MTRRGRIMDALLRLFGALPLRLSHALANLLGFALLPLARRARAVTAINLARCLPELSEADRRRLAQRSLREAAKTMLELGWLWRQPPQRVLDRIVRVDGLEHFDQALAAGQGVLIAAPHLGAWEILCLYLSSRSDCAILYRKPDDDGVAEVITKGRGRLGATMIEADANGVRHLFRAAKQGHIIGILPDQQPKKGSGEFAPFFGHPALTMVLYSRLAARTNCKPLSAWAERLPRGGGYVLHFAPLPASVEDNDLTTSTTALNQAIEREVRRCPEQYQWSYKRFGIQPDESPSPYLGAP